jgi:exo-poly-alpha-galacturonosidase
MNLNGFNDPAHRLRNLTFQNIVLPDSAKVLINDAEKLKFVNVKTVSGSKPAYIINNSSDIVY